MVKEHMRKGDIPGSREAYKTSLLIAIPAVIEMVSIALMDMIDAAMVGRVGPHAMTSVNITNQPRMLVFSVFMALNIALTAIIARKKGAGQMDEARSCLRHGIMIGIGAGAMFTILAISFARPLMTFVRAQDDVINYATTYFRITSSVLVLQVLTSTICVAQRALGNTRITMKVNVTAKIVSVVLNFLLIEGRFFFPRLEVEGVAYARAIATCVAFSLALASILRKDSPLCIRLSDEWKFRKPMLAGIGRLAGNGMLEQVCLRTGFLLYAMVIAELGTDEFAAHGIAMGLMGLSWTFAEGIGAATTALVGQNLGRKRPDLSIMYGKVGIRMAVVCGTILSIFAFTFRYQFVSIFIDAVAYPDIVAAAAVLVLILACILPVQTAQLVLAGSLRGSGDNRYVALTMLIAVGVMRPLLGFIFVFPLGLGLAGAWISMIFDQIARLVMLFTRFARGKWTQSKV